MIFNNGVVLKAHIQAFLPIRIAEYRRKGGPYPEDWERSIDFADTIACQADTLLFGGKPGEAGRLAGQLVDALAVLSFTSNTSKQSTKTERYRAEQVERWVQELGDDTGFAYTGERND